MLAEGAGDPDSELRSTLASDAGIGLLTLGKDGVEELRASDGASPFPEPRILPPPSLRPVMATAGAGEGLSERWQSSCGAIIVGRSNSNKEAASRLTGLSEEPTQDCGTQNGSCESRDWRWCWIS